MATSLTVSEPHEVTQGSSSAVTHLNRVMAMAGWEIEYVDLDLTGTRPTAQIKIRRADGRWLWARVDSLGRCMSETFHRETFLGVPSNARGRLPRSTQINDVFLGRRHHQGPRSMLRHITHYITDNAVSPVALADVRKAWAAIMARPTRLTPQVSKGLEAAHAK